MLSQSLNPRPTHPPPVQSPWGRILVLTSADWILTSQSMFPLGGDTEAAKGQTRREDMQERSRPSGNWTQDLLAARLKGAKRCANCQATEVTKVFCSPPPTNPMWVRLSPHCSKHCSRGGKQRKSYVIMACGSSVVALLLLVGALYINRLIN